MNANKYILPELPYDYAALEPVISKELLTLHHDIHHQGYVNNANKLLEKLDLARQKNESIDQKAVLKSFAFNVGGHVLHSLFWGNMQPAKESNEPTGKLKEVLENEFGNIEQFKKEFSEAAKGAEGSGWAALAFCKKTNRPLIMQIEKHNVNIYPAFGIIMVVDVWEHAYYPDYKNKRGDFVDAFWKIVNWQEVENRLEKIM